MNSIDLAMAKVFGPDWKSTCSAYLTIFFTVGGILTGYLAQLPHPKPWEIWLSSTLTSLVAIAKLIVGHMTQDAGTSVAVVPGEPKPVPVSSHELPDDPSATVVKKENLNV